MCIDGKTIEMEQKSKKQIQRHMEIIHIIQVIFQITEGKELLFNKWHGKMR